MDTLLGLVIIAIAVWWFFFRSAKKAKTSIVKSVPATFIVFDFETTGLSAATDQIIEIGAIRVNQGSNEHQTFQSFVKPDRPISAETTRLTGITQAMIDESGREISELLPDFREFVGDHLMVAFNSSFDRSFLAAACKKAQLPMFPNKMDCALKKARQAFPGLKSYRLIDLAKKGKLTLEGQHRALGDSQRAMIVYLSAMKAMDQSVEPKI
jgi:DNA polymerase III epsilon subunit family exonuclease